MKTKLILAGTAALALAACNTASGSENAGDNAATADNAAAPADAAANAGNPAPAGASAELTRDYVVGRWTASGDCADAMDFRADGTLGAPGGDDAGRWELNGNRLINVGNPRELTAAAIDADTMEITNPEGEARRVTRCS